MASGANLVLGDVEGDTLARSVDQLRAEGAHVIGVVGDVRNESDVLALRDAAVAEFGTAHLVFNNAGVGGGPTIGSSKGMWDWVLDVNVDGVVNGINAFVPMFLEQGEGYVVNTASLAGLGGVPGLGGYCASKFAVVGISECLYYELAMRDRGVGVSVLCPGFVKTQIHNSDRNLPTELRDESPFEGAGAVRSIIENAVNTGIEASEVARLVDEAVRAEKFWILTHERFSVALTERRSRWMSGEEAPMPEIPGSPRP
jgi:NAD(P)-dependent dehydrogenase (short-subunit alcohol dehydrogenase family)